MILAISVTGGQEDFTISLPRIIVVPFDSAAVLHTVLVSTSTYTINERNQLVYVSEQANLSERYHKLFHQQGFHSPETLATELTVVLNSNAQRSKLDINCTMQSSSNQPMT